MANKARWQVTEGEHGIWHVELRSWNFFQTYINQKLLPYTKYVFRGQAAAKWKLESTLDRALSGLSTTQRAAMRAQHLEEFRLATRGRRGTHPPKLESEDDWWALCQHHGLATPLLDFTASPYVAAYFACTGDSAPGDSRAAVWAVQQEAVSGQTKVSNPESPPGEWIEIIRPPSDENARLVNQAGLFLRMPSGSNLEEWVRQHIRKALDRAALVKISFPRESTDNFLRSLNRMNINHATLFPDLMGASVHCNRKLQLRNY